VSIPIPEQKLPLIDIEFVALEYNIVYGHRNGIHITYYSSGAKVDRYFIKVYLLNTNVHVNSMFLILYE